MADLLKEIQAQFDNMSDLIIKEQNDDLVNIYTDECKVLAPGTEMIVGKEGVLAYTKVMAGFADKIGKFENKVLEVYSVGNDVVTAISTCTIYGKDEKVLDETKGIGIWKKVNGKWHIYSSCWNSNKPTPAPQC